MGSGKKGRFNTLCCLIGRKAAVVHFARAAPILGEGPDVAVYNELGAFIVLLRVRFV
jgi:hypothetical protein